MTASENSRRGVSIALMGIDGAGKTSLSALLRRTLAERGADCVDTSRKPAIRSVRAADVYPARSLERLWLESWRLLLGGGHGDRGPADGAIPLGFTDRTEISSGWIVDGLPAELRDVRRSGPIASALTELAVDQLLQAEVVEPALARGAVATVDGFGFKTATKNVSIARELPDGSMSDAALDQFESVLHAAYSTAFLQPDIGILLDVDPRLAYEWRMRQDGRLGAGEDLYLAGRRGMDAYLELQSTVAATLRTVAAGWGWTVLEIDGGPQQDTVARAVEVVLRHPGVQQLTEQRAGVN